MVSIHHCFSELGTSMYILCVSKSPMSAPSANFGLGLSAASSIVPGDEVPGVLRTAVYKNHCNI